MWLVVGLVLGLLVLTPGLHAQSDTRVAGRILDGATGTPLEFAAVSLLFPGDSTLATGGVTGAEGRFDIPVNPGRYLLKAEYIGASPVWAGPLTVTAGRTSEVGGLRLMPEAALLQEIQVVAEQGQMVLQLDKKVYNGAADRST